MRIVVFLVAAIIPRMACAEANVFYVERGHWSVTLRGAACRALNRLPEDFNSSPYNGLQIVARTGSAIAVEVFFWPQAVPVSHSNQLRLDFSASDSVTLAATPAMGDFMLASGNEPELWRFFQSAKSVRATIVGEPKIELNFELAGIDWVLNNLQHCASLLPKP